MVSKIGLCDVVSNVVEIICESLRKITRHTTLSQSQNPSTAINQSPARGRQFITVPSAFPSKKCGESPALTKLARNCPSLPFHRLAGFESI